MVSINAEDLLPETRERLGIAHLVDSKAPSHGIRYKKNPKLSSPFTVREHQVLILAKDGLHYKQMAKRLRVSRGSIKAYASHAIAKTGGSNMLDAVIRSIKQGYIGLWDSLGK